MALFLKKIFSNLPSSIQLIKRTKFTDGKQYRRIVHFPEDNKYTVEPLKNTHLAGRDPVTGKVVAHGIGGGYKHKYHWIDWIRDGPRTDGPPQVEKVRKSGMLLMRNRNLKTLLL